MKCVEWTNNMAMFNVWTEWSDKWKWKSLSSVRLCDPVDCSPWNSSGQNTGVGSSSLLPNPGIKLWFSALQVDSLPAEPQGKPKNTGVDSLSLLQEIFPTQESNRGLLHCRRILYQLNYQGSPTECDSFWSWTYGNFLPLLFTLRFREVFPWLLVDLQLEIPS